MTLYFLFEHLLFLLSDVSLSLSSSSISLSFSRDLEHSEGSSYGSVPHIVMSGVYLVPRQLFRRSEVLPMARRKM
jgi:hypothetical protein